LEEEVNLVDTGHVAGSGGLVKLGLESEGVHVDTSGGDVGVALVGLDEVEVGTKTLLETLVTVELETGTDDGVTTSIAGAETSVISTITSSGEGVSTSEGNEVSGKGGAGAKTVSLDVTGGVGVEGRGSVEVVTIAETDGDTEGSNRGGGRTILLVNIGEGLGHVTSLNVGVKEVEGEGGEVGEGLTVNVGTSVFNRTIVIEVVSVVEPLVRTRLDDVITLDDPDKLLARMVEVKLNLHSGVDSRLITSELELLNEVLVGELGETSTLISVEVDVVDEEGSSLEGGDAESGTLSGETAVTGLESRNVALLLVSELNVDADLVILHI
jgi:hypothetical protein